MQMAMTRSAAAHATAPGSSIVRPQHPCHATADTDAAVEALHNTLQAGAEYRSTVHMVTSWLLFGKPSGQAIYHV